MPDDTDRSAVGQKPLGRFIGLPGRQIKLNTNIPKNGASAPQEIFPKPDASQKNDRSRADSQDSPAKKKKLIPPRLQLRKELSPFDRYIPIALSIPNTANTCKSQGSQGTAELGQHQFYETKKGSGKCNTPTPIIIVTPTRSESSLSSKKASRRPKRNPRPTSSVYTRAMSTFGRSKTDQDVPPVPRTTNSGKSPGSAKWTERFFKSPLSASAVRSLTWSDSPCKELDSAQSAPEPIQTSSNTPRTIRASIDTALPTPRRSNGWWNLLASPFLGNKSSPIHRQRDNPLVDDDAPDVPVLDRAAPMSGSESAGSGNRRSRYQSHHWLFDGEAAKYYDPTNRFGEASPRQGELPVYDQSSPDLGDERGLERAPTNEESPEVPKSPSPIMNRHYPKGALKMPEPSEKRDSGVIVHKSSAEHRSANFHDKRQSIKSSSIDYDTMSPIVGVASAGQIHRARSIEARSPTPQAEASPNWPFKASAPDRRSREMEHHETTPFSHAAGFDSRRPEHPEKPAHSRAGSFERGAYTGQQYETHQYHHNNQHHYYHEKFPEPPQPHQDNRRRTRVMQTYQKFKEEKGMTRKQERSFLITVGALLAIVVILSVVLAMTITHKHDDVPAEIGWAKVAGYPSMPTGISTVSGPTVKTQAGCVARPELWQCAPPPESQDDSATGKGANFRFEIRSTEPAKDEGSASASASGTSATPTATDDAALPTSTASAKRLVKRAALLARDVLTDLTSTANPAAPANEEIAFLGRTTDGTSKPYMGESTPFTISVLPLTHSNVSKPTSSDPDGPDLRRRDTPSAPATPSDHKNDTATSRIPAPATNANQTAAPAQLYPHPYAQPLRLFNRGKPDEHYGFYSYYERSIFLDLDDLKKNGGAAAAGGDKANADGGVMLARANARCSFTQTRFRVQIWTRAGSSLLGAGGDAKDSKDGARSSNDTSSANDFTRPGSLPYPVTVSVDRHGGSARGKGAYCYGVEGGRFDGGKMLLQEDRGAGGGLVKPAKGAFQGGGGSEWTDGGKGGCSCTWKNFGG